MSGLGHFIGPNADYIVELYEQYLQDPHSLSSQFRDLFDTWSPESPQPAEADSTVHPHVIEQAQQRAMQLLTLVQAVRDHGHMAADIDPLGIQLRNEPLIEPRAYQLSTGDLQHLRSAIVQSPLARGAASAEELVERIRQVYCGSTGYEFAHIRNAAEKSLLEQAVESGRYRIAPDATEKRKLLERLTQVEELEKFLHKNFPSQKWFSIEGSDTLILVLDYLVSQTAQSNMQALTLGMAHRGRLNVLAHMFDKPYSELMAEFVDGKALEDDVIDETPPGSMRDVKYHLGAATTYKENGFREIELQLLANSSHLELVNPIVEGAARALQERAGVGFNGPPPQDEDAALPVLIHGDAAFPGQGIVAETLNFAQLPGYCTGGTIHIISNNQVGFTAEPQESHSTPYPTDMARGYDIPIVHVNGDDIEACLSAAALAFAYRQRFHKDFVIDMVGYRRYGHNEGDEPSFTQPLMYEVIGQHPTVRTLWAQRLIEEGVLSPDEAELMVKKSVSQLRSALSSAKANVQEDSDEESPITVAPQDITTAVPIGILSQLNEELHTYPLELNTHPRLARPLQRQRQAFGTDGRIEWAHAESLAFASILSDGTAIRITGQDTERGVFSQRHASLHDIKTGQRFTPLQVIPSATAPFAVYNSPLSEASILAYEYGYSLNNANTLVLWEAEYGDFVNNAQSVVDEFIVSSRAKWGQRSGLVLLLPHGYEGAGPNHSSGYIERFLQLAAEGNIQVAYCTTAAQYFHLLRRQAAIVSTNPRPLVVMTAKSLLRHPVAMSLPGELAEGCFQPIIDDARACLQSEEVRRVILCTGKVFVDLVTSEAYSNSQHVAVVRVEELYPFPAENISQVLNQYSQMEELIWLQEEPRNRGAWHFMFPKLQTLIGAEVTLRYMGRPERSSPAEGHLNQHKAQQERIIKEAFSKPPITSAIAHEVTHVN